MHCTIGYTHEFQAAKLVHQPNAGHSYHQHRQAYPRPFDPNDLTRRLYIVLAQQKANAKQKRPRLATTERAKEDQGAGQSNQVAERKTNPYRVSGHATHLRSMNATTERADSEEDITTSLKRHSSKKNAAPQGNNAIAEDGHYIPQVAASHFAMTTTAEAFPLTSVHRLSRSAMKFHMQGPNLSREMTAPSSDASPSEQAKAIRRAHSTRESQYERNRFQHPAAWDVAEADGTSISIDQRCLVHAHQIGGTTEDLGEKHPRSRKGSACNVGMNEIGLLPSDVRADLAYLEKQPSVDHCEIAIMADNHRVDWTQSDETFRETKLLTALRKTGSGWALRGRLGSLSKYAKDETIAPTTEYEDAALEPAKSSKSSFFSRFKL